MESFYHPRKGLEIDAKNIEFPDREEGKQHHVFQADKKVNKEEFCNIISKAHLPFISRIRTKARKVRGFMELQRDN